MRSEAKPGRVVLYARVSTRDKQETENQLRDLRRFAKSQNWKLTGEYIDHASGRHGTERRPEFARLFQDAEQGKLDLVLFWSLDRFSREGARETLNHLNRLELAGVKYRSYTQPFFNTAGPFREALVSILAALAEQEAHLIRSRITAGIARARSRGATFGRPRRVVSIDKLVSAFEAGASYQEIGTRFGISKATAYRRIQQHQQQEKRRPNADRPKTKRPRPDAA